VVVAEREVAEPFGSFYKVVTEPASWASPYTQSRSSIPNLHAAAGAGRRRSLRAGYHRPDPVRAVRPTNVSGENVLCKHKLSDETFDDVPVLGVSALIPAVYEDLASVSTVQDADVPLSIPDRLVW